MNKCISILIIITCLIFTGCVIQPVKVDGGGSEITNGRIFGTIYHPDHSPASFAIVTFVPVSYSPFSDSGKAGPAPDSVVANEHGQYRMDSLPMGFYNILSKADSGKAYLDSVFIAETYDTRVDDTLEVPSSIQGVARLEGTVIDHSNIVVLVLGIKSYTLTHNTQGEYIIPPQAPGKYRLRFLTTVPGYGYCDTSLHISPGGKPVTVDTVLLPLISPQLVKNVRLRYHKHTMRTQLSWPAAHPSLIKGYNVYRAVGMEDVEKQNDFPLTDTIFNQCLFPFEGQTLYYTVATVDLKGKESRHSSVVSIAVEKAYQNDSIMHSPNLNIHNSEFDFDRDGNLYICSIDQILRKFSKSGNLLLETPLDGKGGPMLPKLKQAMILRHSAQGFILISDLFDFGQDTTKWTLHKFDEDLKYLGKVQLNYTGTGWIRFELYSDGSLYSQFLLPKHAFFVDIGPEGELIFRPQIRPTRLYRYKDSIPGSGIVWKTAPKKSDSLPPVIDGKIGKLTVKYDPKTMYINLNWSLLYQMEGRGFFLYFKIDNGNKFIVKKTDVTDVSYRESLIRFTNRVVQYSVNWVDREYNEVLLDSTPRIEVKSALTVDGIELDWIKGSQGEWHMAVHPDGSLFFLKGTDIIKCDPRGGNCQTRSLNTAGYNFKSLKPLNIMTDEKGRVITALMGSDSTLFPPYHNAQVLLYRFNGGLALQDSLVLDVGREESATSFFCSPNGEIFHHTTLWYKTRMTVYDTSFVMRKTVELPGIIKQIQVMHDTVFIYRTRGSDCDKCLLVYYDSDFNKLGQVDNGFYFEQYSYLRTNFNDIHRLPDGRFVVTDEADPKPKWHGRILSVVGLNDSLEAKVPCPPGTYNRPVKSNGQSVYMWAFPSRLYVVDTGVLRFTEKDQTRR